MDTTGTGEGLAVRFLDGLLFAGFDLAAALDRGQRWGRLMGAVGGNHLRTYRDYLDWT